MAPIKTSAIRLIEDTVTKQFKLRLYSIHGTDHWNRVKEIGFYLAGHTEADLGVVGLFSFLHDSRRENEFEDPEHGFRATEYVLELRKKGLFEINDKQLDQLLFACKHHNNKQSKSDDLTIQTCWDADRLDLYRLGEIPDEKYLYTEAAKKRKTRDFVLKLLGRYTQGDTVQSYQAMLVYKY